MSELADERRDTRDTLPDRRRSGRADIHNPHLLALLRATIAQISPNSPADLNRRQSSCSVEAEASDRGSDDLGPAFGILASAAISGIIWFVFAIAALAILAS